MDPVEVMELNDDGLIQYHRVDWGWRGFAVLEKDAYRQKAASFELDQVVGCFGLSFGRVSRAAPGDCSCCPAQSGSRKASAKVELCLATQQESYDEMLAMGLPVNRAGITSPCRNSAYVFGL